MVVRASVPLVPSVVGSPMPRRWRSRTGLDDISALVRAADEAYDASMEGATLQPSVGEAAAELDESWQALMSSLAMETHQAEQSMSKGVKVRIPGGAAGRSPRGRRASATTPRAGAPNPPPLPGSPRGGSERGGAAGGPSRTPLRPTSEAATIMHTFDAHTELRLCPEPNCSPRADATLTSSVASSSLFSSSVASPRPHTARPAAAQAALDALTRSPRHGLHGHSRQPVQACSSMVHAKTGFTRRPNFAGRPGTAAPNWILEARPPSAPWAPATQPVAMRISSFRAAQPIEPSSLSLIHI